MGAALDAYRLDMNAYPPTEAGLKSLWDKPDTTTGVASVSNWRGPYLKKAVPADPWGNPYQYKSPGTKGEYELISFGKDGKEGGEGDDADIVSW